MEDLVLDRQIMSEVMVRVLYFDPQDHASRLPVVHLIIARVKTGAADARLFALRSACPATTGTLHRSQPAL